jgi:hypothetical protein
MLFLSLVTFPFMCFSIVSCANLKYMSYLLYIIYLVVVVTVTSARANSNVQAVGAPLPLPGSLACSGCVAILFLLQTPDINQFACGNDVDEGAIEDVVVYRDGQCNQKQKLKKSQSLPSTA